MIIKTLNGLLATATLSLLGACSTPCGAPGGLCAPIEANTSATQTGARATATAAPDAATLPAMPAAARAQVQTMPVDSPGVTAVPAAPAALAVAARATRIGVLLPLRSETLGPPSEALRAGFMAAWEREQDGLTVNIIDTGDSADETLNAYMAAVKTNDIIVGPLSRSAVTTLADSGTVAKPTIALNHPDGNGPLPANMLVVGLSIEEDARQVARWAATEHPGAQALIVSGQSSWQRRLAAAFEAQWRQQGNRAMVVELTANNGYLQEAALNALRTRVDSEPPGLLFAALDPDQLRQVRGILGTELPAYGTSSVNPGADAGVAPAELDGTRLLDLPWQIQADHPAVMIYPRWSGAPRTLDMDRLYALGIDAYRIARAMALRPGADFRMDGVTGRLAVSFSGGQARFERMQSGAVYEAGAYRLIDPAVLPPALPAPRTP